MITISVGSNIKKRRYELRMSQQDLANAMGYKTRSTIAKIESGENDVSQKKLLKFAEILDTSVEALISGYAHFQSIADPVPDHAASNPTRAVALILAGGKSGRNLQNIPNQFIDVNGKPIIVHAMDAYQAHPFISAIYIVCLKGWEDIVSAYANQYGITKLKGLITGSNSGTASLKKAFDFIQNFYNSDDILIIQEATRPLVSTDTISKLLHACSAKGSATMCHSMKDYVQFDISEKKAKYIDRDIIIALQSPEAHRFSLLSAVFNKVAILQHPLTESCCTMLLNNLGYNINFVESDVNNIKIVREEDIAAFSALIKNRHTL